jgi:hypothetical protein
MLKHHLVTFPSVGQTDEPNAKANLDFVRLQNVETRLFLAAVHPNDTNESNNNCVAQQREPLRDVHTRIGHCDARRSPVTRVPV